VTPLSIFISFLVYTVLLFTVSILTSKKTDNRTFFLGNRQSPWFVVAYGMIGASLSGVTFISIPGDVLNTSFSYMMIVLGYLLGYYVIANVLLPLYYGMELTSIYTYLERRFGFWSYKTGASFFLISRVIGASFRMFLVVDILQVFVFDHWNIPFVVTVTSFIILILLYTYRSGIKTIVWTDTLQTTFMLLSLFVTILIIANQMDISLLELIATVKESDYSTMIITDWQDRHFFLKDFLAGAFIAIVMTGLDQDMMQKNLTCRNLRESKKNIYWMSAALVPVNLLFLTLGAILIIYSANTGINFPERTDHIFPTVALQNLPAIAGVIFIIGLIAAAYSSADSALTALTTSFSVDILGIEKREMKTDRDKIRLRQKVHLLIAFSLLMVIIVFRAINDESVISTLFTVAGYTYGPLLGMFTFGLFTRREVKDRYVPLVAVISPIMCYLLSIYDKVLLNGYNFGFEMLIINGIFTGLGLLFISYNRKRNQR
jgi:solute:Na+ symporter, SSS family